MHAATAPRRRPGTAIFVGGIAAVCLGLVLFAISAIIGAVQGHTFDHLSLLAVPLVLVIGGLTAATAGGIQRAMN